MKLIHQDVFREIKKSTGRFVSLFLIVALGVAFYAGIRSCNPDMLISADTFYDNSHMHDIRVMSTLGLTDDDVKALENVDGVESAYGTYSADFISQTGDAQSVIKLMALTEGVDEIVLEDGRMPENKNECLIDNYYIQFHGYEIGDELEVFTDDDSDITDTINTTKFTIVGSFVSSQYLSHKRGTTSVGSGKLDGLAVVLPEVFNIDYYTEIDILARDAEGLLCYSDEYEDLIENVEDNIDEISDERSKARYDEIKSETQDKVDDAQKTLDENKQKLADAKEEYNENAMKLDDGKKELEESKAQLESSKKELEESKSKLASSKTELENNKSKLEASKTELESKKAELTASENQIEESKNSVANAVSEFETKKTELKNKKEQTYAELDAAQQQIDGLQIPDEAKAQMQAELDEKKKQAEIEFVAAQAQVDASQNEIESYEQQIISAEEQLAAGKQQIAEAESQIASGEAQIAEYEKQIAAGEAQIADAEKQIADGEEQIKNAEAEIKDGEAQLSDAKKEIEDAQTEVDDAQKEIDDAQAEVDKIEMPEWYVLNRDYLSEYSSYQSDAERVGNIGKVFPIIFFIVAAMVCLTTMTRMVDEERTQIGTYKALGYSKGTIMSKFIVYALIATVTGSVAGALVGSKILPMVIINVYKLMYPSLIYIVYPYNLEHCLVASLAALVCIIGATLLASVKTLLEEPANLMRPVAPKQGKKLLLERITPVWKKIPFTWKNALRNFVRYKKRLFMTLFGIVGSTALLLVGFGLKDAVNTILFAQYGEIYKYNEVISLDGSASDDELTKLEDALTADEDFDFYERIYQSTFSAESESAKGNLDVYLLVPEDVADIDGIIDLHNRTSGEHLTLDNETVIVSEKMAKVLSLSVGDTFEISENHENAKTLTVGGIAEHYVYNYIYMTPELYEELYGEFPEYNEIVIVNKDGVSVNETDFGNKYMKYDAVGGVMSVETFKDNFADMLTSMDSITLVLIICAGALTFVVLFNLNNINIRERSRELATLKVLGFYDIELSQYIYRENVLITIIGVALGVLGGYFLNEFVVSTVEVDIVMFGREIYGSSYLKSILIAIGFTVIVNIIVHFKLKKIDMATSLKSVE